METNFEGIGELTPEQRALLMLRLRKRAQSAPAAEGPPRLRPAPRDTPPPLSFAQQRLWFLHQLDPLNPSYNVPYAIRLSGPLDVSVLARTLDEITARHEALRTSFRELDGRPVQHISPARPVVLPVVELRELAAPEREAEVERLIVAEARRPFDLSTGPLMRTTLLRLGPAECVLLFTMHHIISDGWSMTVLVREVKALYKALSEGGRPELPALPIQYADYAHWQREWLQGAELEAQLAYWRRQLGGAPDRLELATDRPRQRAGSYRGDQQNFILAPDLVGGLRLLAQREGVTLFMVLLAAFQVMLRLSTGEEDICVGTPIAGRGQVETEDLIGFFVNTLVLRTDLTGNPTFRELLVRVREVTLGAFAHQDVPFEKIVEEVRPERSLSHTPLFQVLFALHNTPASTLEIPGLSLAPLVSHTQTTKFDLALYMEEVGEEIFSSFQYSADLFEPATISRMVQQFRALLSSIVADPERPLSRLSLSTEARRRELLSDFNDDF